VFIFVSRLVLIGMLYKLVRIHQETELYELVSKGFTNAYYVISSEGTRRLMASPEVVGYECCKVMAKPISAALKALNISGAGKAAILTILRGGLNYPIEECCYECGIKVDNINFMSCERVIENKVITGLEIKYEKICPERDCTLLIGDILASGDTFRKCFTHFVEYFHLGGGSLKRVVFFTIGGTKAIGLLEELTEYIRGYWPDFEGFKCIFVEGMFTVYEDKGVTGVNVPMIDFGWKGGVIAPEFREFVCDYSYAPALLEKCIIYDGGARRYEIRAHYKEVEWYWRDLLEVSSKVDFDEFIAEKVGYARADYRQWLEICGYPEDAGLEKLYAKEQNYLSRLRTKSLTAICEERLKQLKKTIER